jgi:iron complex transport system substrate-binding protein
MSNFRNKILVIFLCILLINYSEITTAKENKSKPLRIVSLGGIITETVFALGMGSSIVGVDVSSIYPSEANRITKVGYWRGLSAEGVLSLKPSLVLCTYDTGPETALKQIKKAGVTIYKTPGVFNIETAKSNVRNIASLVGKKSEGEELVKNIEDGYKQVQQRVGKLKRKYKTLFIYFRGGKIMNVGGKGTPAHDMIELAGGENLGKNVKEWKNVTSEYFIANKPEVLVVTRTGLESIGGLEKLKELPGVSSIPAVKTGKVIVVDDLAFLGFGPRLNQSLNQLLDTYSKMK